MLDNIFSKLQIFKRITTTSALIRGWIKIKTKQLVITLFVIVLLLHFVSAQIIVVDNEQLTININYANLQDNEDAYEINNHEITLKNNGVSTETVTLEITDIAEDYNFELDTANFNLGANEEKTVQISGEAPVDANQGEYKNVALLKINTSTETTTPSLNTKVVSMIDIDRYYVYANSKEVAKITDNNGKVRHLNPNDKIELRFRLENLFDDGYDYGDIEGTVQILLEDNHFGDDIDEEENFNLDAGSKIKDEEDEIVLKFEVPSDAEEDNYDLIILITGTDENDAEYELEWNLKLEVEKKENDLRISQFTLSPADVSCSEQVQVIVKATNYGSIGQRNALLTLYNIDLGINERYELELNKGTSNGNSIIKQYRTVISQDLASGTYPLVATLYYNQNTLADEQIVDLVVKKCPIVQTVTVEPQQLSSTKPAEELQETTLLSSSAIVKSIENPYSKEDLVVALIILSSMSLVVLIIIFMKVLLKK